MFGLNATEHSAPGKVRFVSAEMSRSTSAGFGVCLCWFETCPAGSVTDRKISGPVSEWSSVLVPSVSDVRSGGGLRCSSSDYFLNRLIVWFGNDVTMTQSPKCCNVFFGSTKSKTTIFTVIKGIIFEGKAANNHLIYQYLISQSGINKVNLIYQPGII